LVELASKRKEQRMEDREVLDRTGELVDEEHELYHRTGKGGLSARKHERIRQREMKAVER
jgi:hypothetical protein